MGYTRYWKRTDKDITEDFVNEVNKIIEDCDTKGIIIRGWDGTGLPEVTLDTIRFNGNADTGLEHETFFIGSTGEDSGFNFCKTACKPYDYAVRETLRAAERYGLVFDVSDDGENEEIISDNEYIKRWG